MAATTATSIEIYTYHLKAVELSDSHKLLDGVAYSVALTVPKTHAEYPLLVEAIQARRVALGERQKGDEAGDSTIFPPKGAKLIA